MKRRPAKIRSKNCVLINAKAMSKMMGLDKRGTRTGPHLRFVSFRGVSIQASARLFWERFREQRAAIHHIAFPARWTR